LIDWTGGENIENVIGLMNIFLQMLLLWMFVKLCQKQWNT